MASPRQTKHPINSAQEDAGMIEISDDEDQDESKNDAIPVMKVEDELRKRKNTEADETVSPSVLAANSKFRPQTRENKVQTDALIGPEIFVQ